MKAVVLKKSTYHSARVAVAKNKIYTKERIEKLLPLSFEEILKELQEKEFKKSIDNSFMLYEGFFLIEKVLNQYLSEVYDRLIATAPGKNQELLKDYYLKYQMHNLMVLLRCKQSKEQDITPFLIGDTRSQEKFVKAFDFSTEEALSYISKKLKLNLKEVEEAHKESLFALENYLYKVYYERLRKKNFVYNSRDEKEFELFIKRYVDLINARTFAKLRNDNENHLSFASLHLPGGSLNLSFFEKLKGSKDDEFFKAMNKAFENMTGIEEFESLTHFDKALAKHKSHASSKLFRKVQFGSPFYALKYFLELEQSLTQLRILLKGKYLKLSKEELEALL